MTTTTAPHLHLDGRGTPSGHSRLARLAAAGALLFPLSSFAQAALRPGFDLRHHGLSLLALGPSGQFQVATFVLSGVFILAGTVGWRAALPAGIGHRALPILLTVSGLGMIGGGLFQPDPEYGFPAGAPAGPALQLSTGAALHTVSAVLAFESLAAACLVFALRRARQGRRTFALFSAVSGVATVVISAPVWGWDSASIRLAVATVVVFGWLAVASVHLARPVK